MAICSNYNQGILIINNNIEVLTGYAGYESCITGSFIMDYTKKIFIIVIYIHIGKITK